ncbi:YibE/F family protein [Sinanaerobacter chloroacetimidivorans]|uniref:YibE/F family protein n=1 Tax=Sinanaerobacter chloroacetimidivorans TaxID=2818044 RepID=A0A8J7W308_9FIRM|nr:YibE/F family protein [Sinanaerobacter chloroacetimidivorans]MBR0599954.1 YibE/F family protein [Sinanaerobacter chloroacetimidivorans]
MKLNLKLKRNKKDYIVYFLTIILSLLLLYAGNQYAMKGVDFFDDEAIYSTKARVVEILDRKTSETQYYPSTIIEEIHVKFTCEILTGEHKGEIVEAAQNIDSYIMHELKEVEVGDKIVLYELRDEGFQTDWTLVQYVRADTMIWLGAAFFVLLLLFGRFKGFNTIISLSFTCLAIFFVFIPSILSGKNIYLWSILTCIFTIAMTLMVIYGAGKKSYAAGLGCFGGIIVSGALTQLMSKILGLTGLVSDESYYLTMLETETPIDLKAIIFAAIIIGAMGAIMDVAISIASALYEIKEQSEHQTPSSMIRSGIRIGQDMMGTMANTLILAYIGSSLSVVLLLLTYNSSMLDLMNREMVIIEILQALIGSIGLLFTIPLTSIVCGLLYTKRS